jgi:phage baseplate assembly protein gpV
MADTERIRIEIAFEGPQVLSVLVPAPAADDLDRALSSDDGAAFSFEAEDGRYTVLLRRVVYVKRFARESRVGFGANS